MKRGKEIWKFREDDGLKRLEGKAFFATNYRII